MKKIERIFLRAGEDPSDVSTREKVGARTGLFGILCNLALSAGKLICALLIGSISLMADALNNLSDAISSIVTVAGFRLSAQSPDKEHPYGHGRIEYVAGILVSFLILMMGVELFQSSLSKIVHPVPSEFSTITLIVLLVSIALKAFMAISYRASASLIHSETIKAESLDSLCDVAATFVVLASLLLEHFFNIRTDGWGGLIISLFVLWEGLSALRATMQPLLGQPADPQELSRIRQIVLKDPRILGVHDIVVHDYGPERQMVSLHAELSADTSFQEAHEAVDSAEKRLMSALGCSAVIHMDPVDDQDSETMVLKGEVHNMAHRISARLSRTGSMDDITVHDFRLVHTSDSTRLIFDVLIPYDMPEKAVREAFQEEISQLTGHYESSITIDHPL